MSRPLANPVPRGATFLGLALFACAWLPLTPQGRSFFRVAVDAFGSGVMPGLVTTVGMGSPFLFGLAIAVGSRLGDDGAAARIVRMPVTMMHSQLLLAAWFLWRDGDSIAALPLLLFAAVSGFRVITHSASVRASGNTAPLRWYIRAGATLIAAVAGWLLLQRSGGLYMGLAVPAAGLCALGLILRSSPLPVQKPAFTMDDLDDDHDDEHDDSDADDLDDDLDSDPDLDESIED